MRSKPLRGHCVSHSTLSASGDDPRGSVFAAAAQLVRGEPGTGKRQQPEATVNGHAWRRRGRRRGTRPLVDRFFRSRGGLPSGPVGHGLGGDGDRAEEQQDGAKRTKRHSEIEDGSGVGLRHVSERSEPAT